jgi:heptosyltransferase II
LHLCAFALKIPIVKIIVRGTNWIGDAVMQIPALRRLKRMFGEAHLTLATRAWAQGIFQDADFIDDFLIIEPGESIFQQARKWRQGKFDLAVLFTNSFQTALVAKLGRVKTRFGYAHEGRSFLLTNPIKKPAWKNEKHEIHYYLNLVSAVETSYGGLNEGPEPQFGLTVSKTRKDEARQILAQNGVDLSKKLIAFCPGSTNSRAKRWPSERYAHLNDRLQKELKANIILLGDRSEFEVCNEVSENSKIKPINLTGKTSLAESTAILSLCDLLISNDTGPAHISAALGTNTIVIFGPTNPATTHPIGAEIIRKEVDCSPCMLRDCPIDHRCMTRISADEIFEKSRVMLT